MIETPLKADDAKAAGIQSLVDMLEYRAHRHSDELAFRYLASDGSEKSSITYGELQRRARAVAAQLVERTVPGDRVMLLIPPGLDYIAAFFGCVYAGTMAVPAYPPNPRRADPRVARMVGDCGARVALVTSAFIARLDDWLQHSPELRGMVWLDVDRLQRSDASQWRAPALTKSSLAMLQYTSGSTGDPRGVMLTHGNLLHNLEVIHQVTRHREGDNAVFWLPPFHDMGLIGGILEPIYANVPTTLMAPASFLQQPLVWLKAITKYRATTSGAPNFAYALCVERISEEDRQTLDLSSWRTSFNGAEPINAETIARFHSAFRETGLRDDVMLPCYGLAEATLLVSGRPVARASHTRVVDRARLEAGNFREVPVDNPNAVSLVTSGSPVESASVFIVDPDTSIACDAGVIGEIWVSSGSVAAGYWNQKDATAATFHASVANDERAYLRTGDLGVLSDGDLIVTGRLKDLVILDGRNYYPHDIEVAAERSHIGLRAGYSAAFSVPGAWREQLVFVAEVSRRYASEQNVELFQSVRTELAATVGVVPHEIVLISHHSMPRTSSGKVQRRACRAAYLGDTLDVVARWQSPGADVAPAAVAITAYLIDWVSDELQIDASRLNPRTSLRDVGLDSLAATRLLVSLEAKIGRRIEQSQLWEQPDIGALAEHLASYNVARVPSRGVRADYGTPTAASTDITQWTEYTALRSRLDELDQANVENPFFHVHDGISGSTAIIGGRTLINFASYNYLGLSGHPVVTRATQEAVAKWGTSVSASRVVSGERPVHRTLERELAEFVGAEDSLVFIGGHPANVSTISHLMGAEDVVLCDSRLHNSGMQGAEFSSARRLVFPHNDWQSLDRMLSRVRSQHRRALVVIEGVYSADGDIPDLEKFVEVKSRHHAMLMVDEAHSLGVIGKTGRGIAEHCDVRPDTVDIWMGTLSKSLASCGGYIAGRRELIEYLRYTAPGFVYSVGITPANAAAALAALRVLQAEPERVARLHERARLFAALCRDAGLDTGDSSGSAVIPVIVGDSVRAMRLSQQLFEAGINVQPMVAPAVAESASRLRFFISSSHEPEQLRQAVNAVELALRHYESSITTL